MYTVRKKIINGRYFLSIFILLTMIIAVFGYESENQGGNDKPGANEVFMIDEKFSPETKMITIGTTIKWINKDNKRHNVISGIPDSPSGLFKSGRMRQNDVFTFKFDKAGTFPYYCSYHDNMIGKIIVK